MRIMLVDDEADRIESIRVIIAELANEFGVQLDFPEQYQIVPSVLGYGEESGTSAPFHESDFREAVQKLDGPPSVAIVDYWLKWQCSSGGDRTMTARDVAEFLRTHWRDRPPFYILITSAVINRDGPVGEIADLLKVPFTGFLLDEHDFEKALKEHLSWAVPGIAAARRRHAEQAIRITGGLSPLKSALGERYKEGDSQAMARFEAELEQYAKAPAPVLLLGETGVGKSLIAKAIHELSGNGKKGPFYRIEMSGLPEQTFESEMWGHKRGAFTGAVADRKGRVEMATNGTLFLDEIGDLPLHQQQKLLNFIETGTFFRMGDSAELNAKARIIAATCRPIEQMVQKGTFREDLWFRLNVLRIRVPPLRERDRDVLMLALDFLRRHNPNIDWELSPSAKSWLLLQSWPGNIRELDALMCRVAAKSQDPIVTDTLLELESSRSPGGGADAASLDEMCDLPFEDACKSFEKQYIRRTLARCGGNRTQAATASGVDRQTIYRKIEEFGLGAEVHEIESARRAEAKSLKPRKQGKRTGSRSKKSKGGDSEA